MEVLLTSPEKVLDITNISDNINGKLLNTSITEATNIDLRNVIGDKLLEKLKELVSDDSIETPEYSKFKELLDMAQYFLAYAVAENITRLTWAKVDNIGVRTANDENSTTLTFSDMQNICNMYNSKRNYYKKLLQNYILRERKYFTNYLNNFGLFKIHSNLYSSESCGIWLGGARSKGYFKTRNKGRSLKDLYDN